MLLEEKLIIIQEKVAAAAREAGRSPSAVAIEAATKTQTSDTIRAAIACGITICGENRVQELTAHLADYAYDGARVHFIGHLQTNKVKQVVGRVDLIESVDSLRLLEAIDSQAGKLAIIQDILLEVNVGAEPQKGGVLPGEVAALALAAVERPHVRLRGIMAVPPPAAISGGNRHFFAQTRQLFVDIRTLMGDNETDITCLSMGMSGDYEDAVREGATLVRVGSALFGPRPPMNGTLSQA